MARSIGSRNANLLELVEEKAFLKKVEEEHKEEQVALVPYLPKDCISKILIQLPLQSLSSKRFVCKPWYHIISSDNFIKAHLRCSESVLIFQKPVCTKTSNEPVPPNTFSVEASVRPWTFSMFGQPVQKNYDIQFIEFKGGKSKTELYNVCCLGNIRATCNGLILLNNVLKNGLTVMNPVTRKLITLPVGTISPPYNESYGFVLNEVTGEYKVVHLFQDELGYIGCETLNLWSRMWRGVNGPSFGMFGWLGYSPISAIGALHWIPHVDHSDYIVSMEVNKEKFQTISLPKTCRTHDRIVEKGGFLCFVTHEELKIDIWILEGLGNKVWTMHHRITRGCIIDMVPLFSLRISGDMIFMRDEDGSIFAYDFTLKVMTQIEREKQWLPSSRFCLPHVNSLVSWEKGQNIFSDTKRKAL
ncbi:F-box protein [Melia azedarach]|uniref:F-box protein n=1 Tax=Melia azedarach TaxID=155640 RepID=A0ACC1XQX0_MELAZ|nr:F-box protein [Melia azedarach]